MVIIFASFFGITHLIFVPVFTEMTIINIYTTLKQTNKGYKDKNHEIRLQSFNTKFISTLKFITCLSSTFPLYIFVMLDLQKIARTYKQNKQGLQKKCIFSKIDKKLSNIRIQWSKMP